LNPGAFSTLTGIVAMTLFVMARLVRATYTSTLPR
jgi:hypothetical protein